MAAPEFPIIVAHNIMHDFEDLGVTSFLDDAHRPKKMVDDRRDTTWRASSIAAQSIPILPRNILSNGTWQDTTAGWTLDDAGQTVVYSRDTVTPYRGDGMAKIDIQAWASGTVKLISNDRFTLKAGRTYHCPLVTKQSAGGSDLIWKILDSTGSLVDAASTKTIVGVGTSFTSEVMKFTVPGDINFEGCRLEIEFPGAVIITWLDDVWLQEARAINTVLFDQGHGLRDSTVKVQYKEHATAAYADAVTLTPTTNGQIYSEFTEREALHWNLDIASPILTPQIAQVHLSDRFNLPMAPDSGMDPTKEVSEIPRVVTEAGTSYKYAKFTKAELDPDFSFIDPLTEYPLFEQFWDDIEQGQKSFWYIPWPTSQPARRLFVEMTRAELNFPFQGHLRSGSLDMEEVLGAVKV